MCPHPENPSNSTPGSERGGPTGGRIRSDRLKPLTYSVMHLVVAMGVAFALTRDWRVALGVGLIEPLVQTVAYTIHEAAWARRLASRT